MEKNNLGTLYIVGTPIGNLQDITLRAITVLKNCDLILAEDTRHSIHLLQNFSINTPLKSYHKFNEQQRTSEILALLEQGMKISLITDAGMPMVSDPGYILVKSILEHKNNIKITVVPGPSALTSAISLSGIDCEQFCFAGFLANKSAARIKNLQELLLAADKRAIILYEAPHRLLNCLIDIQTVFGCDRVIAVLKELTKSYENIYHDKVSNIIEYFTTLEKIKGEYVIVISRTIDLGSDSDIDQNIKDQNIKDQKILDILNKFKSENIASKSAVKIITELMNLKKNYVYNLAIRVYNQE